MLVNAGLQNHPHEHATSAAFLLLVTLFRVKKKTNKCKKDLKKNRNITILLSIDSASFPLGTGPKPHEIWHGGYYPVAWTNKQYRMVYMNMGHNDMDYEGHTNATLSSTFSSRIQNQFLLNAIYWLGSKN